MPDARLGLGVYSVQIGGNQWRGEPSEGIGDVARKRSWGWRVASSARPQTVAIDHTRLDHAGVQGQEHDAGIQVVAGLEGSCQAHFHRFCQAWIVALGEALRAQHAVAEKLRRGGVRGRVGAGTGLPEQLERGELHRFRHEPRVEAHAAQRLVETLQLVGAAENAEQAEHGKEANTPAPRREGLPPLNCGFHGPNAIHSATRSRAWAEKQQKLAAYRPMCA